MPRILIKPGDCRWVVLQDALRESHETLRERRAKQIAEREAGGIPLDDSTDWEKEAQRLDDMKRAVEQHATREYRDAMVAALQHTDGALEPIPAYEEDERAEGFEVFVAVMNERDRMMVAALVEDAVSGIGALDDLVDEDGRPRGATAVEKAEARARLFDAQHAYLSGCVKRVKFPDGTETDIAEALPIMERNGFQHALFWVARDFQELPEKKSSGFSPPPPSTSTETSTATPAPASVDGSGDASETETSSTSREPGSKLASAQGVTSSKTATSPTSSPSTASRKTAPSASTVSSA